MSNYPDFSARGYKITTELGTNDPNGRVTYQATQIETKLPVVIKEFQFDRTSANWSGYDSFCREKEILQQLDHPNIPKYIDYFETDSGFCLVSEYKKGISLANSSELTPAQIKKIALELLEILIYLQRRSVAIVHRDIKPENILIARCSEKLQVYLIDFGSAELLGQTAEDNLVRGTLGFMPPEQTRNLSSSLATDLYSLGVTLICLLTGTKSTEIGSLIDRNYRLSFKSLLPQLNPQFLAWLEKMSDPKPERRFRDAVAARGALRTIETSPSPALVASSNKQLKQGFAAATFIAGVVTAVSALQYQCALKSPTSSTPANSLRSTKSEIAANLPNTEPEFVCSQSTEIGQYRGYLSDRLAIASNGISCAQALDNCQFNAASNPNRDFRCTWNEIEIFSTRD